MNTFFDIADQKKLRELLLALQPESIPLWGKMKPQQMIEHLITSVEYTNGKKNFTINVLAIEAIEQKQKWIYTDIQIPKNLILGTLPSMLKFASLDIAIEQLIIELDNFHQHFTMPGITSDHAAYGAMNYKEWLIWHGKHFTHHLKQFNLLPN